MMATIRALIVDDSEQNIKWMTPRLDREFQRFDWTVDWTEATDQNAGLRAIADLPPFDLVVLDLLFPRADIPGEMEACLYLITEAKERSSHTFILAISIGHRDRVAMFGDAVQLGAHEVVRRPEFSSEAIVTHPREIAVRIREHLVNNGTIKSHDVVADGLDPGVQSLLHQVGEPTIAQLYDRILAEEAYRTEEMEVRYLAPGASGAAVCSVSCHIRGAGTVRHVLKVSKDHEALLLEASSCAKARLLLPPRVLVAHQPGRPVGPVGGWYALGAPLVQDAITFRKWLKGDRNPSAVHHVLASLFVDGLWQLYNDSQADLARGSTLPLFPHFRQRLVLSMMEELEDVLTREDGGGLDDVSTLFRDITAFVSEDRVCGMLARSMPPVVCGASVHGDLHGGNILIYDGDRPVPTLIDLSAFGPAYWGTDAARLAVDILMRCVDAGAESMFFTKFGEWRDFARMVGTAEPAGAPGHGEDRPAAQQALVWLAANLRRLSPTRARDQDDRAFQWSWHVALAVQFLRATYSPDIPGPKRALALLAAHDQLICAEQLYA